MQEFCSSQFSSPVSLSLWNPKVSSSPLTLSSHRQQPCKTGHPAEFPGWAGEGLSHSATPTPNIRLKHQQWKTERKAQQSCTNSPDSKRQRSVLATLQLSPSEYLPLPKPRPPQAPAQSLQGSGNLMYNPWGFPQICCKFTKEEHRSQISQELNYD